MKKFIFEINEKMYKGAFESIAEAIDTAGKKFLKGKYYINEEATHFELIKKYKTKENIIIKIWEVTK